MATVSDNYGRRVEIEGTEPYTIEYTVSQVRKVTHVYKEHLPKSHDFNDMIKFCRNKNAARLDIMNETGFADWAFNFSMIDCPGVQFVMISDWFDMLSDENKVTLSLGNWE